MLKKGINSQNVYVSIDELKVNQFLIKDIKNPSDEQIDFMVNQNPSILLDFIPDQTQMSVNQIIECLKKDMSLIRYVCKNNYLKKEIYEFVLNEDVEDFIYFKEPSEELIYFFLSLDKEDHKEKGLLKQIKEEYLNKQIVDYAYQQNYLNLTHAPDKFITSEKVLFCLQNKVNDENFDSFKNSIALINNFETKNEALNHLLKHKLLLEEL